MAQKLRHSTVDIFDSELFKKIANSSNRIPSEAKREAWIADTILLLASELGKRAVLSGGSAVRNITRVMRATYDVDFDTDISSLREMRQTLKHVNQLSQLNRTKRLGALYENPERNNVKTFYGQRKMLHMLRTTDAGGIKVHIMHAPEMPEMFANPIPLELVSIETTDRNVSNARAEHLFFRKCIRANTEKRVEDFLDTYNILQSVGAPQRGGIIAYVKTKDPKATVNGLKILAEDPASYIPQLNARLTYVEKDCSRGRLKEIAYSISQSLLQFSEEICSSS